MSATVNTVILAGHLTKDPQVRFIANEKAVAAFGLAINHRWKNADGTAKEETVFVDVEVWGRLAEITGQYLRKGSAALVEGRLKLDVWEKEGQKQSKLKVVATSVQFLDRKDADIGDPNPPPAAPKQERPRAAAPAPVASAAPGDDEPF